MRLLHIMGVLVIPKSVQDARPNLGASLSLVHELHAAIAGAIADSPTTALDCCRLSCDESH